ncbi:TIGR00266 family protein [Pseudenhygromyxa sp. WMMC2535]|uniref:TIGR00266 family protein n=1 Tax=Pseudenhygromyxa sp. WMMC2535 TaxID=2712867 RepID=UPI001554DC57|nr:TIGR00266 family protein [Pseudenhygromyxa sp. WMMC2535]NVB37618.1 TIGR00266 family protein [Pseudenhygromyxa sp. WMMC2535]
MQHQIEFGPAFAWLKVQLAPNEVLQAEAGAMVRQTPGLEMDTRLNAGRSAGFFAKVKAFFAAMARKFLGGETVFVNDFHGPQGGEVVLAPSLSGHIMHQLLDGNRTLFIQASAYLASTGTVDTKLRFGGLKSMLGGEGLVLQECSGQGDVWINSYGGITEVPINGTFVVDTGHIVAFDGDLTFKVRAAGSGGGGFSLKSFLFSGEGLVCEFTGQGRVWIQSRNLGALVGWITPYLKG